jgi:hypothetical protein
MLRRKGLRLEATRLWCDARGPRCEERAGDEATEERLKTLLGRGRGRKGRRWRKDAARVRVAVEAAIEWLAQ